MVKSLMDAVELTLFSSRLGAACDEMGAVLRRAALSPNIRERLDFSCALFSADGRLAAQAAHIPVHLGSMAFAMGAVVRNRPWAPDDALVFNDPFLGGTHLPDVTLVAPVFAGDTLVGFVANRAHHADIGADAPGSMPLSTTLEQEGIVIPPSPYAEVEQRLSRLADRARTRGDLAAQLSANRAGARRVAALAARMGPGAYRDALDALDAYGARTARSALTTLPTGCYAFTDWLDDDGAGTADLAITLVVSVSAGRIVVDFDGTAPQCPGNLNCPLPVTAAAVWYAFRCLMPDGVPACHGAFASIEIRAPEGSLVNARRPAAVAAGNVETSQRIVDAVLGALAHAAPDRICAAAQGTMNNLAVGTRAGARPWDYYETLGGGLGAHAHGAGLSAVQAHMTNTLNTPSEVLELELPLRVREHAVRRGSGGAGQHYGGDGLVREIEFLQPATATLLTERRVRRPWGLAGGGAGAAGVNLHNGTLLPAKCCIEVRAGDRLRIETPGGGGWGPAGL